LERGETEVSGSEDSEKRSSVCVRNDENTHTRTHTCTHRRL